MNTRKLRKAILTLCSALLLVSLSVGITVAYLTSTDEVKNTFTVGQVKITLDEAELNDKYQPIKKWNVDLSELTQGKKDDFLKTPKSWYLKIEGLYRQFIEDLNESNDESISQDFCLIITIRDNKRLHEVYDEVTKQLDNNGFVYSSVKIDQQVSVSTDV